MRFRTVLSTAAALGTGLLATQAAHAQSITTVTADGITIYGETYFGDLDSSAPLVLLFHQGGANGRGEYSSLAQWLNDEGFRAIAWDQRRGGSRFGSSNRTVDGLPADSEYSYCDPYPDLQAALHYVVNAGLSRQVVAWGSSYSATLVFQLAARNPEAVRGVASFSPAAGEPMAGCEAREWVDDIDVPLLVLRPASEMELPGPIEQRRVLEEAGVDVRVVNGGVHGSSMLLDERTGADMSSTRASVAAWLRALWR